MAKDYNLDPEKAMEDALAPAIVGGEEQVTLIPAVVQLQPIERDAVIRLAAKMNAEWMKKCQPYLYWLLLLASTMVLTNYVFVHGGDNHAVSHDKLITPVLVMFGILLCAIFLMVGAMKQM